MRLLILLAGISALGASCSTMKKVSAPAAEQHSRTTKSSTASPVFIENISFTPGKEHTAVKKSANTINTAKEPAVLKEGANIPTGYAETRGPNTATGIEALSALRFKYAILLDAVVEDLTDARLLEFMEEWYGTRYRLGGSDKSGIDCSAFVQLFMTSMYGLSISRTCREQYADTRRIKKSQLQEGDLVFFKTRGKSISHVGIYLRNNKFIHASTSSGVMISDLNEDYFDARYAGAGRIPG
jgi:cell wall-associated NlpC family hydrolase